MKLVRRTVMLVTVLQLVTVLAEQPIVVVLRTVSIGTLPCEVLIGYVVLAALCMAT